MGYLRVILVVTCLSSQLTCFSQKNEFKKLTYYFLKEYPNLNIAPLQVSYVATLNEIKTNNDIKNQEIFFLDIQRKLAQIDTIGLSSYEKINFQILEYETVLNLERIELEKQWKKIPLDDSKSIITVPNGKNWYAYLLKKWVDKDVTPDEMFDFGLTEIKKVKSNMKRLQIASGLSESAFENHLNRGIFFYKEPR